jgi:hypothetical protein
MEKELEEDEYRCDNCGEVWNFFPEDYESHDDYPTVCPMCIMPVWQMIKDTFEEGGFSEVIYWLKKRYLKNNLI